MSDPCAMTKMSLHFVLAQIEEAFKDYSSAAGDDQTNAKIYGHFCDVAKLLGPAISAHLRTQCRADQAQEAADSEETAREKKTADEKEKAREKELSSKKNAEPDNSTAKEDVIWRFDTPFPIRKYNVDVLARLIYDLKPAISGAFPHQHNNVDLIVRDLIFDNPPVALMPKPPLPPSPRNAKRPADAGGKGRHHLDMRSMARATLYEVIVFQSARRSVGGDNVTYKKLCRELTNGEFNRHDWRRLAAEPHLAAKEMEFLAAGRASTADHPELPRVHPGLALRAKDRVISTRKSDPKKRVQ